MPETDNGRVTMAVLATKLDGIDSKLDELCLSHREVEARLREVEKEQEGQKVRSGVLAGLNAGFTAIATAVVAAFRNS